jgi:hypothetical protein
MLYAHHVADSMLELLLLIRVSGVAILLAALVWLFYLALEPYVRRLRPWTLVSWTRLLNGGFRDAVVGRDVLIGMIWGVCVALALPVYAVVARWAGYTAPEPETGFADVLLHTRTLLAYVANLPVNATLFGLGLLLLFLVLRLVTRRDLIAAGLVVAILAGAMAAGSPESRLAMAAVGVALYASFMFIMLRYGVLSGIAALFTADLLDVPPQSLDVGSWTGSATLLVVPLLMLLAIAAFRTAIGGHLGVRRYLRDDLSSRPV